MKTQRSRIFSNGLLFLLVVLLAFGAHLGILALLVDHPTRHLLIEAYATNLAAAFTIYVLVALLIKKMGGLTAYLFFAGWILKAGVYLLFFKPHYETGDQQVDKAEFLTYFIPFAICLIVEVIVLVRLLNEPSNQNVDKTSS